MPRNMSFSLTTQAVRERRKTVTRRLGWSFLKPGDIVNACVKCQGLGRGQKVERICQIRIIDVRPEPLYRLTMDDVARECVPAVHTVCDFISMFAAHNDWHPGEALNRVVNRIEFEYV